MAMEEQNNKNEQLTNAQLELQADAAGPGEVKRISYAGLIARRFFRQRSAVVGLTILGILVLLAIFGPLICKFDYTDPDFTAINVAPNARHWFGTDGGGFDLFACVVHGLGRSLVIGLTYAILTTAISAIVGTAIAYARGWGEKIGMWLLDMLLVIPSFLLVAMIVRAASGTQGWLMLILGLTAFGWIGYGSWSSTRSSASSAASTPRRPTASLAWASRRPTPRWATSSRRAPRPCSPLRGSSSSPRSSSSSCA